MKFEERKYVILWIFLSIAFIFIIRLFQIQVVDQSWKIKAANITERKITVYPSRGLIRDRNGQLLVGNVAAYDVLVVPKDVVPFDTNKFCRLLQLDKNIFKSRLNKARHYSMRKPSIIEKQISAEDFSLIAESMNEFPGFYPQARTLRHYPGNLAPHSFGYISEVSPTKIKEDPYYQSGDYIGANGIENIYEEVLRGSRGVEYVLVDVYNNIKGKFKNGLYDTLSVAGKDITSSLDASLQQFGEQLLQDKRGSIVAIEPTTGEILCLVNHPDYNPNLLSGRVRSKNYDFLLNDTLKPLFNRALQAQYPPGSTFKLVNALVGLQEKTLTTSTNYQCSGGYYYAGRRLGCHSHRSPVDFDFSITTSCNAYYCNVFKRIIDDSVSSEHGYNIWRNHVTSFGFGAKLKADLTSELGGLIPESTYYDHFYQRGRWKANTIISLAIGQGEIGVTPLQMANLGAILANRGWYYSPHIIKEIQGRPITDSTYTVKNYTTIDPQNFVLVVNAMQNVIEKGTGRGVKFDDTIICGKTGTAQNPHGKDHSIFLAFAPKDNPKIAIAVYVENVGFGSTWAAPITSLMIEKYLTRETKRPELAKRISEANLLIEE